MAKEGKGKFTHKGQQAVLLSSDLKYEPARGSKYRHSKKYQVFFSEFRTACLKETKTSKFFNGSLVNNSNITRLMEPVLVV